MTLFLTLLPLYVVGNLHCLGMCGPLVLMIGSHRYRYCYFAGRAVAFAGAGAFAAAFGSLVMVYLQRYQLNVVVSLFFGIAICYVSVCSLRGRAAALLPVAASKALSPINKSIAELMLKDRPYHTFLFGLLTIALPCGQTIIVFSACAIAGDVTAGLFNGAAFALLTSPSLWLAMNAQTLFKRLRHHYNSIMGCCGLVVGVLSLLRAAAEAGVIGHFVLSREWHVVLY